LASWRFQSSGAQAWVPPCTCAHVLPAQQLPGAASQASPALTQTGSPGGSEVATQTVAPGDPTQAPLQQSSGATQPPPSGAQLSRQE
jgi:hypothetical protein